MCSLSSDENAPAKNVPGPSPPAVDDTNDQPTLKRMRTRRWTRCDPVDTPHFSHIDRRTDLARGQQEGYCLLCPDTFTGNIKQLHRHMARVHSSRARMYLDIYICMCKCSQVSSRGSDVTGRNSHYHCPVCHNPSESPATLKKHMNARHDIVQKDMFDL